jgi:hypothetical protein
MRAPQLIGGFAVDVATRFSGPEVLVLAVLSD